MDWEFFAIEFNDYLLMISIVLRNEHGRFVPEMAEVVRIWSNTGRLGNEFTLRMFATDRIQRVRLHEISEKSTNEMWFKAKNMTTFIFSF